MKALQGGHNEQRAQNLQTFIGPAQHRTIPKCQMHHGEGVNTGEMLMLNKVFTLAGGFTRDSPVRPEFRELQLIVCSTKKLRTG